MKPLDNTGTEPYVEPEIRDIAPVSVAVQVEGESGEEEPPEEEQE